MNARSWYKAQACNNCTARVLVNLKRECDIPGQIFCTRGITTTDIWLGFYSVTFHTRLTPTGSVQDIISAVSAAWLPVIIPIAPPLIGSLLLRIRRGPFSVLHLYVSNEQNECLERYFCGFANMKYTLGRTL